MKKTLGIENGEVIWKDKKKNEIVVSLITFLTLISFFFLTIYSRNYLGTIIFLIMSIISLFSVYVQLIRGLSIVYSYGVLIGNITLKNWHNIGLKARLFIRWKEINSIKFTNHEIKVPKARVLRTFIIIKTNDNKGYKFLVYDFKGFIQALKKLNKYHLLSKESRYR